MPKGDRVGQMQGFQLWANLPSSLKMTAPRYQEVKAGEIPEITDDEGIRFLLVSGKLLQEPVAWYGPIVMNTQAQLQQAYEELKEGTFLKPSA
jgi:redox-sensitive bicupin YhaK (pirin superfamily)